MNCFECGSPAEFEHHVVPRSLGGTKTVPLCKKCHDLIHDTDLSSRSLMRASARRRALAGKLVGGFVPYGWDLKKRGKGLLIPNEFEAAIVQYLNHEHLNGRVFRELAAELNQKEIPTKNGGKWHASQIQQILRRKGRTCIISAGNVHDPSN